MIKINYYKQKISYVFVISLFLSLPIIGQASNKNLTNDIAKEQIISNINYPKEITKYLLIQKDFEKEWSQQELEEAGDVVNAYMLSLIDDAMLGSASLGMSGHTNGWRMDVVIFPEGEKYVRGGKVLTESGDVYIPVLSHIENFDEITEIRMGGENKAIVDYTVAYEEMPFALIHNPYGPKEDKPKTITKEASFELHDDGWRMINIAPVLTGISQSVVNGYRCPRVFALSGKGFKSDLQVKITSFDMNITLDNKKVEYIDEHNANITINTMDTPDSWDIRVRNGDGPFSETIQLIVKDAERGELGSPIGEIRGVIARSNGKCTGTFSGMCANWQCQAPYQCVDYAKKFYKKHYPEIFTTDVNSTWGTARNFWNRKTYNGLAKIKYSRNGVEKVKLPRSGDMIFFDTQVDYGHVAIVTHVNEHDISLIQQNIDRNKASDKLSLSNDKDSGLIRISELNNVGPVLGWLTPLMPDN